MCMFQDVNIRPVTMEERKGYKVVSVTPKGFLTAPLQGGRYKVGKWNRAKNRSAYAYDKLAYDLHNNPGFNVFDNYADAKAYRYGNPFRQVVRVIVRQVVTESSAQKREWNRGGTHYQTGFCALEMFISKLQAQRAVERSAKEAKLKPHWRRY